MSQLNDFQVRTMRREELAFAIDLAAREGWNPGLNDAECFFAADPGGFLIGELAGEPIGCISAVSYAGRYGFIGLYIVRPEFRGQGYGMRMWQAAMARLAGHNVGLDGVLAQQGNYAKSGFRLAYRNVRYQSRAAQSAVHASVGPPPKSRSRRSATSTGKSSLNGATRSCAPGSRSRWPGLSWLETATG